MLTFHDFDKCYSRLGNFSLIVEGKKDKDALMKLGFSDIKVISRKSIFKFIEELPKNKKYVILTDFDREGEKKNKIFCKFFERNGISFNKNLRNIIKSTFQITKIEELIKFSRLKEDVFYGKISTINYKIFNRSKFYRKWYSRKARYNWRYFWTN